MPRPPAPRLLAALFAAPLAVAPALAPAAARGQAPNAPRDTAARDSAGRPAARLAPVRVVGAPGGTPLPLQPGAVTVVGAAAVRRMAPLTTHELVRRAPGVHAVDEEGLGFRQNIGIRGTDPARSFNVVLLEDGVPVVHAPYSEPQTYYSPQVARMEGVEVLRGVGVLRHGPQTTAGVINYLTPEPPAELRAGARVLGGGAVADVLADLGGPLAGGRLGAARVGYLRRQVDDLRGIWARVDDLSAKWVLAPGAGPAAAHRLTARAGYYAERTNSSYLGLTQAMYDAGAWSAPAPDDRMDVRRPSASLTHEWAAAPRWALRSTAFAYRTRRDNRRQDFARNAGNNRRPANFAGTVLGDTLVPGGAIFLQRTTGARNRTIGTAGLETRLTGAARAFGADHELEVGARAVAERNDVQFVIGRTPTAAADSLVRDRERRGGVGLAAWVQDRVPLGARVALVPAVRVERYQFSRTVLRASFPRAGVRDTLLEGARTEVAVLPGLGATWQVGGRPDAAAVRGAPVPGAATLFASVHRGFAPSRLAESIDNSGVVTRLEPERSWNAELGVRTPAERAVGAEVTAFALLFENQTVSASDTWGRTDELAVGVANGGRTRNLGVEAAARADLARTGLRAPLLLGARAALVDARFTSDRFYQGPGGAAVNVRGNRLPYVPRVSLGADATLLHRGHELQLAVTHVGQQFGDRRNLAFGSADGQAGPIPAYTLLDATAGVRLPAAAAPGAFGGEARLVVAVKNLLDDAPIVSRRPQGIRLAAPRQVMLGVRVGG